MKLFALLVGLPFLFACDTPQDENPMNARTFANAYVVDEQACLDRGLTPTKFVIEYPDNMEVTFPENERNHISIKVRTGELILEELWITETGLQRKHTPEAEDWIKTFVQNYNLNSKGLTVEFMGEDSFNGENIRQIKGEVDFMSFNSSEYNGIYKMMMVLPMPEVNDSISAVSITMIAHEYSEIQTLEDFETKGVISKIIKTFRYLE